MNYATHQKNYSSIHHIVARFFFRRLSKLKTLTACFSYPFLFRCLQPKSHPAIVVMSDSIFNNLMSKNGGKEWIPRVMKKEFATIK
jgi:hypothetical protein